MKKRFGFTLVELLITIAIVVVLSGVVIFLLNPIVTLQQARDASRASGINTLNKAIGLYYSDAINNPSTLFMGSSSVIYISVPDPSATSTVGDQCQGLGLPTLPTGYTYHCAGTSTYTHIDGTGWVPINFNNYSAGNVISSLPTDPTNTTSTNLYYTYETDGIGGFNVNAFFESQKYAVTMSSDSGSNPLLYEKGTNTTLASGRGLIGYWSFEEGSGSSTLDYSGSNATGTWHNATVGTNGYYSAGKVGAWAGAFDGNTTYVSIGDTTPFDSTGDMTIGTWIYAKGYSTYPTSTILFQKTSASNTNFTLSIALGYKEVFGWGSATGGCSASVGPSTSTYAPLNTWYYLTGVRRGATCELWFNGTRVATGVASGTPPALVGTALNLGGIGTTSSSLNGYLDDTRIYSYALSSAQIQEMYNAEK